jgi:hypothetical protein
MRFRFKNYLIILKTEKLLSSVRPMPQFISDIVSRSYYCVANPYNTVAMMKLLICPYSRDMIPGFSQSWLQ